MSQLAQLLMLGVSIGVIYGLVAMGLVLIYRASGVLNFAQGQMIVFGAMITWAFMAQIGLSWWLSIILALACAWVLGMLIERLTIRPMLGQPVLSVIVMTLGLGVVLEALIVLIWGAKGRGYPSTPFPSEAIYIGGINLPPVQLYSIVIALVILWGLVYYLSRSREGLAMQALADDTQCARSLGVKASSILSSTWS